MLTIKEFVTQQTNKLNQYSLKGSVDLNTRTTYFSQRDNYTMPHRTCNSSANAMFLDWLLRSTQRNGLSGDNEYLKKVLSYGDTIYHENQTKVIKDYGFSTVWTVGKGQQELVKALVTTGIPIVVNILHRGRIEAPRGGHIILLCGYLSDSKEWICQDPYGTLRSDYVDTNGRLSRISERSFNSRWEGGFRTLKV